MQILSWRVTAVLHMAKLHTRQDYVLYDVAPMMASLGCFLDIMNAFMRSISNASSTDMGEMPLITGC